mgnify:FL=1
MGAIAGIATLIFISYYIYCAMGDVASEIKQIWKGEPDDSEKEECLSCTTTHARIAVQTSIPAKNAIVK